MDPIYFETPAEFRAWLEQNHAKAEALLVGFYKKGTCKPSMTWPESVDGALCFGWIDGVRKGVDAFVLKYRLVHNAPGAPSREDVVKMAGEDGRQAVRLVREKAGEFGYRPDRVGMIGFSAGGMVTSEALFGPKETRPDFVALIYGIREIKEIPDPAPPLFLAVAADDAGFVAQSVDLFTAYRKAKGLAELHVFQSGAHGFVNKGGGADHFMDRLEEWLRVNKLLASGPSDEN